MLNKEEKRIFDMYVLPALEKLDDIYFHKEKLYEDKLEMEGIPEGEYNKKVFPYEDVLSDLWDIIHNMKNYIENIRDGTYTKPVSILNRQKRDEREREKRREEREKIRNEVYKKGEEMAVYRYNWLKLKTIDLEQKKRNKIARDSYNEGSKAAKEMYILNDEQILRKAKSLELEMKLGFRKELKKKLEEKEESKK
ncbi:hypothetical protein LCGC14_0603150 [marine sediment metagenome]|uniref:Uncharacterized protein n=1 Tax=marine sediment metagenome TaxID=412755 RepID=A0A0F9RA38_9ZZZZ